MVRHTKGDYNVYEHCARAILCDKVNTGYFQFSVGKSGCISRANCTFLFKFIQGGHFHSFLQQYLHNTTNPNPNLNLHGKFRDAIFRANCTFLFDLYREVKFCSFSKQYLHDTHNPNLHEGLKSKKENFICNLVEKCIPEFLTLN